MIIACVLQTKPFNNRGMKIEYTEKYVLWLQQQVRERCGGQYKFVCLSNVKIDGVKTIPLEHDWPGWWSKIELFKNFNTAFYIDLDTVLTGDITDMVFSPLEGFEALRNLSTPKDDRIGSGIMRWNGDYSHIYRQFKRAPEKYMEQYVTSQKWGDQGFIFDMVKNIKYLQDRFPGKILSFKVDLKKRKYPPEECSIVCFHGKPKPMDVDFDWVPKWTD